MMNKYDNSIFITPRMIKIIFEQDIILEYFRINKYPLDDLFSSKTEKSYLGYKFENTISKRIIEKCNKHGIKYYNLEKLRDFDERFKLTKKWLNDDNCGVILQGIVSHDKYLLRGCPDILIRNKYLKLILTKTELKSININLIENSDWSVIEIKNTLYEFNESCRIITDNYLISCVQTMIYKLCIENMLSCKSNVSTYLLGNAYSQLCDHDYHSNFIKIEDTNIIEQIINSIYVIKLLYSNPSFVKIGKNIFPNYNNKFDHPYRTIKKKIGIYLGDTDLLCCNNCYIYPRSQIKDSRFIFCCERCNEIIEFNKNLSTHAIDFNILEANINNKEDKNNLNPIIPEEIFFHRFYLHYKLFNCLLSDYIPVYLGDDSLKDIMFKSSGFIYINDNNYHFMKPKSNQIEKIFLYRNYSYDNNNSNENEILKNIINETNCSNIIDLERIFFENNIIIPFVLNYSFEIVSQCFYILGLTKIPYIPSNLFNNIKIIKDISMLYTFLKSRLFIKNNNKIF